MLSLLHSLPLLSRNFRWQHYACKHCKYAAHLHTSADGLLRLMQTNTMPKMIATSPTSLPVSYQYNLSKSVIPSSKIFFSSSSSSSGGMFTWLRDKFENREKTRQATKLVNHISLMADSPTWTIQMFKNEVDETLSSWRAKIPGMGGTAQIKIAKNTQKVVNAMVDLLGGAATAQDVSNIDRKQKLKLSIASDMPVEEVNIILKQFRQMDLMHRILRYRKENGLAIPVDETGLKLAMQQDGMKILTNAEKKELREAMAKSQSKKII